MKSLALITGGFSLGGLALLGGAFFSYSSTENFLSTAIATDGVVVELVRSRSSDSTIYRPVVEFQTPNGELVEFTSSSGSNPPSYSQGEAVKVLYQEGSPEQAKINGFFDLWGVPIIIGGIGSVFFLVGSSFFAVSALRTRKINRLKTYGSPVFAKFQSVKINRSFKVNGRNPYQILAHWQNPATSELHVFVSDNIWFDPTDYIDQDDIVVLIDKDNPSSYYVDTSFLPKLAS